MIGTELIVLYSLIPMVVAIIGGFLASLYTPKPKFIAGLQHFVAGVVVAAVATELLPKIMGKSSPITIAIGFVSGVVVMLLLHALTHVLGEKKGEDGGFPIGLSMAAAIDLLIDGALIGVAFVAGKSSGILIALSLSLCAFFLNLTVSSTLKQKGCTRATQIISLLVIALMLPIGAFLGGSLVAQFPTTLMVEVLAFGVAALLYLGVEELLAEAHAAHDRSWTSAAFFLGFLVILLFQL